MLKMKINAGGKGCYLFCEVADHDLEVERVDRDDGVGCIIVDDHHLHASFEFWGADLHGS